MKKILLVSLFLIFSSCSSNKSDAVIIVYQENYNIMGKIEWELKSGEYTPKLWVSGYIVIFRENGNFGEFQGESGQVYKITDDFKLELIEQIDLKLSDEEIENKFLN